MEYSFANNSNDDIVFLNGDFVLSNGDKVLETVTLPIADKENPLYMMDEEPNTVSVKFKKHINLIYLWKLLSLIALFIMMKLKTK